MSKYSRQSGFGLIEVLISVLLVVMIGTASLGLQYNSFLLSDRAATQTQAYYLASEGVEILKIYNERSILKAVELSVNDKDVDSTSTTIDSSFQAPAVIETYGGKFRRMVVLERGFDSDYVKATIKVCYDKAAVDDGTCNIAIGEQKNSVKLMSVIKLKS